MTTILPLSYFTTNDDGTNQPNILPPTCLHTNTAHHESIADHIKTLPNWHRRLLVAHHSQEANDLEIWRTFRPKKQITIATDGGLAKQAGTFGWIMVYSANIVLFKGSGPVDGPIETNSSTQSELGGYTAPLLLVTLLARHWGLKHKCKFTWVVDSTAAISQVVFATNPAHANKKYPDNVDYLSTIKALHKELKRPIRAKWVKAHQDDNKKHEHLSRHTILNIEADRLATQHQLRHHIYPKHKAKHLQSTKISVCINGTRYHSNIPSNTNFHINGTYMRKYLEDKHNWTDQTWQEIDMEGFGSYHKSLTPSQRI